MTPLHVGSYTSGHNLLLPGRHRSRRLICTVQSKSQAIQQPTIQSLLLLELRFNFRSKRATPPLRQLVSSGPGRCSVERQPCRLRQLRKGERALCIGSCKQRRNMPPKVINMPPKVIAADGGCLVMSVRIRVFCTLAFPFADYSSSLGKNGHSFGIVAHWLQSSIFTSPFSSLSE